MQNSINNFLIELNSENEKLYCKKYNIELQRLENGITILGIPCRKDFTSFAHIKYEFSEGSYGNQAGAVHFLEHFINKKARPIAQRNGLNIRAWTSQIEIGEEISGVANPEFKNYGAWTVLQEIRKALEAPLDTVGDLEKSIETERKVIKAEIKRVDGNHDYHVAKHFRKVIYSKENPLYDLRHTTGTEEDVDKLTTEILKDTEKGVLIPKNLLISFYTEGDLSIAKNITEEIEKLYLDFPRVDKDKNNFDKRLLEKISEDIKPGKEYRYDSKLKNGIITTNFAWIFKTNLSDPKYFAQKLLKDAIITELFAYSRRMGWGYFTTANVIRPTDNLGIIALRVDLRKDDKKELLGGIKEVLLAVKNQTKPIVENENKRQTPTEVNSMERLSLAVNGIKEYEAMIDADEVRKMMLKVTATDLNNLIDEMLSTNPAMIVTGDLS